MANLRFPPHSDRSFTDNWENLRTYYQRDATRLSDNRIIDAVYGGEPIDRVIQSIDVEVADAVNRIVNITLHCNNPRLSSIIIAGLNFKQWLVESSLPIDANDPPLWEELDTQTRIEICQNELARWSVIIKSATPQEQWAGQRIAPELTVIGHDWCDEIELVNNCTTSDGFELKVRVQNTLYHGSFNMPQLPYRELCQRQAGAWARQGFGRDAGSGLIDPDDTTFTFGGELYFSDECSDTRAVFNLERYRTLSEEKPIVLPIEQNNGSIDYCRWGEDSEYFQKPQIRHLVMHPNATDSEPLEYIDPPCLYSDVQAAKAAFKLPNFEVNGVYEIYQPTDKSRYLQLSDVSLASIRKTSRGLFELSLLREKTHNRLDLHQIVIGNLDFASVPIFPEFFTIDRFGFSPRPTTSLYNPDWMPAVEVDGTAELSIYAFLLADNVGDGADQALFIQPESWGIERAVLSFDKSRTKLTIDLISFERIMPVWQGVIGPIPS